MSGFPEMAEVRAAVADQSVDLFEAHGIERFRFGLVKFGQDVFRVIPAFRGKNDDLVAPVGAVRLL